MTNASASPVTFDARLGCDPWHSAGVAIRLGSGEPQPLVPGIVYEGNFSTYCAAAAKCGRPDTRVVLAPGHKVYVAMAVDPSAQKLGPTCELAPSAPVPPGNHELTASLPLRASSPLVGAGILRMQ